MASQIIRYDWQTGGNVPHNTTGSVRSIEKYNLVVNIKSTRTRHFSHNKDTDRYITQHYLEIYLCIRYRIISLTPGVFPTFSPPDQQGPLLWAIRAGELNLLINNNNNSNNKGEARQ